MSTQTAGGRGSAPLSEQGWLGPVGADTGIRPRYQLIGCALHGHALAPSGTASTRGGVGDGGGGPGTADRPVDPALAREMDGLHWDRCLRCDAWLPRPVPGQPVPVRPVHPDTDRSARAGITPPIRGRLLRDRYVLRLIALDRAVHVVVLAVLGVAILVLTAHRTALRAEVTRVVNAIQGGVGGPVHDSGSGIVHDVNRLFSFGTGSLYAVTAVVFAYAALEAVEMVGLWLARRWAEYLTFLATIGLLPLEVYELTETVSPLKIVTLAINLAIAAYLLLAKRLFGLRGGGRREDEERRRDTGWLPVDRATPPTAVHGAPRPGA